MNKPTIARAPGHIGVYFGIGSQRTTFMTWTLRAFGFKYTRSPYVRAFAFGPFVVGRCDLGRE